MISESFTGYYINSIKDNWHFNALSDYNGETFTYKQVGEYILSIHNFFKNINIQQGDKIALLGKNSARWCIIYLATTTYGAVIVPILPDFKSDDLIKIINHSDSKALFIEDSIYDKLEKEKLEQIKLIINLKDFNILYVNDKLKDFAEIKNIEKIELIDNKEFNLKEIDNNKLAVISYTSGTTGNPKGVMLTHNCLAANMKYARENMPLKQGDKILSFLPLAHTFGCAFEFLFPFTKGCHITILTKTPSPQIILEAFSKVKPALILSVPLIIEKIYKKQILPKINKPIIKIFLKIPLLDKIFAKIIRDKLNKVFGNNFNEVVIGGAPFNHDAELFFKKIGFKYTVGYGMTECGPLISYASHKVNKVGSSGKCINYLEMKIQSDDPYNVPGEILVKGENVMIGYYKNEEATKTILDEEGWLHTGDLATIDKEGFIFIKGRSKNMILGPDGKNIYPEEIESILNNFYGIAESIIIEENGKLVALVYPDYETLEKDNFNFEDLNKLMDKNLKELNHKLPSYMNVSKIVITEKEFEKTPKKSIRRFIYQNK